MTDKLDQRAYLRITEADKKMVEALAKKMNLKESDIWRHALKKLYDDMIKQD